MLKFATSVLDNTRKAIVSVRILSFGDKPVFTLRYNVHILKIFTTILSF